MEGTFSNYLKKENPVKILQATFVILVVSLFTIFPILNADAASPMISSPGGLGLGLQKNKQYAKKETIFVFL